MPLTKEHETDFLCAFARTVLAWQQVEGMLSVVFSLLATPEDDKTVAFATINAVNGLEIRLDMADAAALVALMDEKPLLEKWTGLLQRIRDNSVIRNRFVHLTLVSIENDKGLGELKLMQGMYKKKVSRKSQNHEINLAEIKQHGITFRQLAQDLGRFVVDLSAWRHLASP